MALIHSKAFLVEFENEQGLLNTVQYDDQKLSLVQFKINIFIEQTAGDKF